MRSVITIDINEWRDWASKWPEDKIMLINNVNATWRAEQEGRPFSYWPQKDNHHDVSVS